MIYSIVFTAIYVAYMLFGGLFKKLSYNWQLVALVIFGVYALTLIVLIVVAIVSNKSDSTEKVKKQGKVLKFIRFFARLASLAMGIAALALSVKSGKNDSVGFAYDTVAIIFSIIMIILSVIPMLCGGIGRIMRWLLSPPKIKKTFSFVILEWYSLITSGNNKTSKTTKNVSIEFLDDIARCVDTVLIPALGKKYIYTITIANISETINSATEEDRPVVEGILKSVFSYATECGYVPTDICRDMNLQGSIDEKPKEQPIKKIKKSIGEKIGGKLKGSISSILKNMIDGSDDE
jgi:hypothetical protein